MRAHKHFRDASAWIAKAPPMIDRGGQPLSGGVVLRFPIERVRRGHKGLAGGVR
jgi:hypothetical protein